MPVRLASFLAVTAALTACQPASEAPVEAAESSEPALAIERIYASPSLSGATPRSLTFSPDGSRVTFLRAKEDNARVLDLWATDIDGGEPYLLVDSQVLAPDER